MADIAAADTRARLAPTLADDAPAVLRWPSWSAIISGTVVASAGQILVAVLGAALGLSAYDTTDPAPRIAAFGAIWWLVTGTIAMIVGGIVVGRFAGTRNTHDLAMHGLTVWAATAILGMLVVGGTGATAGAGAGMLAYGNTSAFEDLAGAGRQDSAADDQPAAVTPGDTATTRSDTAPVTVAEAERAREYTRNAAWLTFCALALGIVATIQGAIWAARRAPVPVAGSYAGSPRA